MPRGAADARGRVSPFTPGAYFWRFFVWCRLVKDEDVFCWRIGLNSVQRKDTRSGCTPVYSVADQSLQVHQVRSPGVALSQGIPSNPPPRGFSPLPEQVGVCLIHNSKVVWTDPCSKKENPCSAEA